MRIYRLAQTQEEMQFMQDDSLKRGRPDLGYSYVPSIECDYDYLDELASTFQGDIHALSKVLKQYGYEVEEKSFPTGKSILLVDVEGTNYVIDDVPCYRLAEAEEWVYAITDIDLLEYFPASNFHEDFWNDGGASVLYHGTTRDRLGSILRDGLEPRDETRGISNRGTGAGVFMSDNPDEAENHYEVVLEIDVGKMRADGYMPDASQEEPLEEDELRQALAYAVGVDNYESGLGSEGIFASTVIFYDIIPSEYIRVYE